MRKRQMSGNDVKISDEERWFKEGVDVNEVEISEKHFWWNVAFRRTNGISGLCNGRFGTDVEGYKMIWGEISECTVQKFTVIGKMLHFIAQLRAMSIPCNWPDFTRYCRLERKTVRRLSRWNPVELSEVAWKVTCYFSSQSRVNFVWGWKSKRRGNKFSNSSHYPRLTCTSYFAWQEDSNFPG